MKLLYSIHRCDVSMLLWLLSARRRDSYARVCRYISMTGDGPLYVVLCASVYSYGGIEARPFIHCVLLAFLIERPIYFVAKNGFKRNRPSTALKNFRSHIVPSDRFSFPSGHTSAAVLIATLSSQYYPAITFWVFTWASMVGTARIILGVHFPTDILVGATMSANIAWVSAGILAS